MSQLLFSAQNFSIVLEDSTIFGRALMLVDVTRFRWLWMRGNQTYFITLSRNTDAVDRYPSGTSPPSGKSWRIDEAQENLLLPPGVTAKIAQDAQQHPGCPYGSGKAQLDLQQIPAMRVIEELLCH